MMVEDYGKIEIVYSNKKGYIVIIVGIICLLIGIILFIIFSEDPFFFEDQFSFIDLYFLLFIFGPGLILNGVLLVKKCIFIVSDILIEFHFNIKKYKIMWSDVQSINVEEWGPKKRPSRMYHLYKIRLREKTIELKIRNIEFPFDKIEEIYKAIELFARKLGKDIFFDYRIMDGNKRFDSF